jgi:hypothetical protein
MKIFQKTFEDTVSAICYSICQEWNDGRDERLAPPYNDVARFLLIQHSQMTDFLRSPMIIATLIFNFAGFLYDKRTFNRSINATRTIQVASWEKSPIVFCRDFIKFYKSLSALPFYSRLTDSGLIK